VALAALTFALVATGCKGSQLPEEVRKSIGPPGGQISSADGALTLYFPPDALDDFVEVVISRSETPPDAFSDAYRVQPDIDLSVALEVTHRGELPPNPDLATMGAITRADFDAGQGRWRPLPRIEFDPGNELVTSTDTELSMFYALLGEGNDVASGTESDTDASSSTTDPTMGPGSDSTTGTTETDSSDSDTESGPLSHAADIQPIWEQYCVASCHEPNGVAATLDLGGDAYDDLINQPSFYGATADFVVPGSSQTSYLMHKLDGTYALDENVGGCGCSGTGVLMPQGATEPLDIAIRDMIRSWIDQGAMP
jgi:hypothetical protein